MYDTVIEISTVGSVLVVAVGSDIDIASAETVVRYITEAAAGREALVVSLARCAYIDSSGIRPLVRLAASLASGLFIVAPPGSRARRLFDLAAPGCPFNLCDTLDEAVARATKGIVAA